MAKSYTKELIQNDFIKLLNKKALNNITVTEIANICEIERKTFYYHYRDIYDLLNTILDKELDRVTEKFNATHSWEESYILAVQFALDNKNAVFHIFNSPDKIYLERYLYKVSEKLMFEYVNDIALTTQAREEDIQI